MAAQLAKFLSARPARGEGDHRSEPENGVGSKPENGPESVSGLRADNPSFLPGGRRMPVMEPAIRFVSDSLLAHPELPKPPASPRLRPGRDFTPMPGHLAASARPEPLSQRATAQPTTGASGWGLAIVAVLVGFGGGLLVAWLSGLI